MSKLKNARKWIAKSLALVMTFSVATPSLAFGAIDTTGHWAEATLAAWQSEGLISGYEDGTLRPDAPITRAEFVQLINKSLGFTEAGAVSFSDVKEGDWFYNGVAIAMGAKYCSGYPDGTFQPNAQVTRAQAAGFVANAAGLSANAEAAAEMKDSANLPSWAAGAIGGVLSAGFMSGYPDGTFAADKVLTRAEAVSTLDRVKNGVTEEDDKTTSEDDVTISEDGQTLQNVEVKGDVIVSEAVGNGSAFIKNVQIGGDLIIEGGGSKSVHVTDTEISGAVNVKKEGVRVVLEGSTSASEVNLEKAAKLEASQNFTGSVDTINVPEALGTGTTSVIKVAADTLNLDGKSSVQIAAAIDTINVAADAADSKIEVISGITVGTIVADGKIALNGSGTVKKLMANVSGITKTSSITVSSTETATGVDKPSTSGGGGGGSSSSSSSSSDDKPKVKSIVLVSGPTQLSYTNGDTLKLDGLKVNLVRTNGTKLEVSYANFAANGLSVTPADGTKLTTAYNDTVIKVTHSVGTVEAGKIKVAGGGTVPDPDPDPDTTIDTAAELKAEIEKVAAGSSATIKLGGNIVGTTTATFNGNGKLTIDLNGFTLDDIELIAETAEGIDFVDTGAVQTRMAKATPKIKNIKVKAPKATVTTSTTVTTTTITVTEAKTVTVDGTVETVTVETKTVATSTTISGSGSIGTVAANSTVTVSTTTVTNVTASASVTLNTDVAKVTVPEAATGVKVEGSGNIANVESNATESVTVNTTGKVDSIVANGPVTATVTNGIGSVAASAPVTLNSAVETVTVSNTAAGVTVTTTSTITEIKTETNVTIAGSGTVGRVEVDSASNVTVTVGSGSTVDTVVDTGKGGTVSTGGDGDVTNGVAKVSSVSVTKTGKVTYKVGESFDITGWEITPVYDPVIANTKAIPVTPSMVTGFNSGTVGTNTITITYAGKTTTADLTITQAELVAVEPVKATAIEKDQKLKDSILSGTFKASTGSTALVEGTLTWDEPETVAVDGTSYAWTFKPTEAANYAEMKGTISVTVLDKTALKAAIATTTNLVEADYTVASYEAVTDALALPETTQAEVTAKTTAITTAVAGLVFAGKADLEAAKAKIPTSNNNKYTVESWNAFEAAWVTANAMTEETNAKVVAKTTAINAAIALLVETAPTPPDTTPPVVGFATDQTATNAANQKVEVASNELGTVYIIKSTLTPQTTVTDFDAAITAKNGAKATVETVNVAVDVSTTGLTTGTYYAYAVDAAGNISSKSDHSAEVTEAGGSGETNTAPDIAVKTATFDKATSANVEIIFSLGSGNLAATGIGKVEVGSTTLTATTDYAIDNTKLTILSKNFTGLAAGEHTIKVTFNDTATITVNVTLTVKDAVTKTITVGTQVGTPTVTAGGEATFAVTTVNVADSTTLEVKWFTTADGTTAGTAPTGVTVSSTPITVTSNGATVTMTVGTSPAATAGDYYFKVATTGETPVTSGVATLTIDAGTQQEPTTAPVITTTDKRLDKTAATALTLTLDVTGVTTANVAEFKLYTKAGNEYTAASGLTLGCTENGKLTITHSSDVPNGLYGLTRTESGKTESAKTDFSIYGQNTTAPTFTLGDAAVKMKDDGTATLVMTGATTDMEYKINPTGGTAAEAYTKFTNADQDLTIPDAGATVIVRTAENTTTYVGASPDATGIVVAVAPAVTLAASTSTNGKTVLTNSTTAMEYKVNDAATWTTVTSANEEIAVATGDKVYIRTAAVDGTTPASLTKELTVLAENIKPFALAFVTDDLPTTVTGLTSATTSAVIADSKTTAHEGDTVTIEITVGGDNSEATAQTVTITPKSDVSGITFAPVSGTVDFAAKSGDTNGTITTSGGGKLTFTFTMPKADVTDLTFTAAAAATVSE